MSKREREQSAVEQPAASARLLAARTAPQADPWARLLAAPGATTIAGQAAALAQATGGDLRRAAPALRRLQRCGGNAYVQRVAEQVRRQVDAGTPQPAVAQAQPAAPAAPDAGTPAVSKQAKVPDDETIRVITAIALSETDPTRSSRQEVDVAWIYYNLWQQSGYAGFNASSAYKNSDKKGIFMIWMTALGSKDYKEKTADEVGEITQFNQRIERDNQKKGTKLTPVTTVEEYVRRGGWQGMAARVRQQVAAALRQPASNPYPGWVGQCSRQDIELTSGHWPMVRAYVRARSENPKLPRHAVVLPAHNVHDYTIIFNLRGITAHFGSDRRKNEPALTDGELKQVMELDQPAAPDAGRPEQATPLQRSPAGRDGAPEEAPAGVEEGIRRSQGGGQPLGREVRRTMERSFGVDFGDVRVHTGPAADALNRAISARAFTTGGDIFFGQGEYNPGSSAGRELLAHELAHVVQQTSGPKLVVGPVNDQYERAADVAAREVLRQEATPAALDGDQAGVARLDNATRPDGSPAIVRRAPQLGALNIEPEWKSVKAFPVQAPFRPHRGLLYLFVAVTSPGDIKANNQAAAATAHLAVVNNRALFDPGVDVALDVEVAELEEFVNLLATVNDTCQQQGLKVRQIEVFSHGGLDGPMFGEKRRQFGLAGAPDVSALPRLPYTGDAVVFFRGCRIGKGQFLEKFAGAQGVATYGFEGTSSFSTDPQRFVAWSEGTPAYQLDFPGSETVSQLLGRHPEATPPRGYVPYYPLTQPGAIQRQNNQPAPIAPALQPAPPQPAPELDKAQQRKQAAEQLVQKLKGLGSQYPKRSEDPKEDFPRNWETLKRVDCSQFVQLALIEAQQAGLFGKDLGRDVNTFEIKQLIEAKAGPGKSPFRTTDPKVGDIMVWGGYEPNKQGEMVWAGHVAIVTELVVQQVKGKQVTKLVFAHMGTSGPNLIGISKDGYYWLNAEDTAAIDPLGSGPYLGFWTPQ